MLTDADRNVGRSSPLPSGLVGGIGFAFVVIFALASYFLWQSREMLHERAASNAETISTVLEQYVLTTLHESELLLQIASDEYRRELKAGTYDAKAYTVYLTALRKQIPAIANLRMTDASGLISLGESGPLSSPVDISDRQYFAEARDNANKLAISPPLLGRTTSEWIISIAWHLAGPDGRFEGLVVANLRAKHFTDLFASLKAGPNSAIILFDANTKITLRHPEPKGPGASNGLKIGSAEFKALWQQGIRSATYRAQSTTDGVWRTYSYRQVGNYPLYVMVGVADDDILAPWRLQLAITAVFLIGLALLVSILARSLLKSIGFQQRAYRDWEKGKLLLEESEARFRTIIEAAPIPFALNDDQQNTVYLNAAFIHLFGYTLEEIPTLADWWPKAYPDPAYRQKITSDWQQHMATSEQSHEPFEPVEASIQCKSGESRTVLVAAAPLSQSFHDLHVVTFFDISDRKQFQQSQEQMLAEQKAMLENDLVGIVKVKDRKVLWANPAFEKMLGYDPGELNGMPTRQNYLCEDAYLALGTAAYPVLAAGQVFRSQIEHLRKDGRHIWIDLSGAILSLESGESLWGVVDITERKEAEAKLEHHKRHLEELVEQRTAELVSTEARASHILQSSADGLYGVNREGVVTFINPAACQLLGYTAEQVIGHSGHELFHHSKPDGSPYPIDECPSHMALKDGYQIRVDNEVYWHADGHPVPVMFAAHPMIQNGANGGAVISFVDVSEQRAAAEARERAIVAAENLARVRSEFLANMSHEIRTPINGVLGFAEIGYKNYQNSEKARNAFDKIRMSGKRLLGVINDTLDFSKIEAGKLHLELTSVVLREVIKEAVDVVQERADAKHLDLCVKLAPSLPQICIGDPLRIGQVLLNLLSNAVKFTDAGNVTLSASCVDETLIFRVTDTGIGIDEMQISQLFLPFQQGDGSMTRRFGGTGLGLTIAKRIAELMEGDIHVESQLGKGSTFEFRLPYRLADDSVLAPVATTRKSEVPTDKRLAGISILIAEDEPINQEVLELNLTEEGARVVVVSNGEEAVDRILLDGRAAYDIILMDMLMPVLGGLDATRVILAEAPDLPIIGQTANAFAEDQEKCLAAGMVGYVAKPIDAEVLVNLVLQHVEVRG